MNASYETHKYAELFPAMQSDEFAELVKDIRSNGLIEPIVMLEGKVLDGRSRLKACIKAGVEPQFVEYDGLQDPLMFVWTKNVVRRHLSTGQRVTVALQFAEMAKAASRERMSKGGKISAAARNGQDVTNLSPLEETEKGRTVDKLADMVGVGRGTMQSGLEVQKMAPELIEHVRSDDLSISSAASLAKSPGLLAEVAAGKMTVKDAAKQAKAKQSQGIANKPTAGWKKVVADCEKLNADFSAFELSGDVPETGDFEKLRAVSDRILAYSQKKFLKASQDPFHHGFRKFVLAFESRVDLGTEMRD